MVPGLLHRPTPTTDTLGIVAALNWQAQMSQGGGSDHNGFPVSQLTAVGTLHAAVVESACLSSAHEGLSEETLSLTGCMSSRGSVQHHLPYIGPAGHSTHR